MKLGWGLARGCGASGSFTGVLGFRVLGVLISSFSTFAAFASGSKAVKGSGLEQLLLPFHAERYACMYLRMYVCAHMCTRVYILAYAWICSCLFAASIGFMIISPRMNSVTIVEAALGVQGSLPDVRRLASATLRPPGLELLGDESFGVSYEVFLSVLQGFCKDSRMALDFRVLTALGGRV